MTIVLNDIIPLLLLTAMSVVFSLVVFVFVHNYLSESRSLKFVPPNEQNEDLQITLAQGIIQGKTDFTIPREKLYFSFLGIPYAIPPVKNLRFRDPIPAKSWIGILDGTSSPPACIQVVPSFLSGFEESEDCLYINVFTPIESVKSIDNSTKLPVMVWIYGGGFLVGSPDFEYFGPDYFLDENIIMVQFSYRLGPFGFLSTEDMESPGNYGLKDQHLALRWVKSNIQYFGGDPDKITIFGQSAGGASVQYQLLHESNKGLFQGAISQSGSTLAPWAFQKYPRKIAFDFGYAAGVRAGNSQMLLDYLRSLPAERLKVASAKTSIVNSIDIFHGIPFAPTIEHDHEGAFFTKRAHFLLETGNFMEIPYMLGFNSMELSAPEQVKQMASPLLQFYNVDPKLLLPSGVNDLEAAKEIKNFYFNKKRPLAQKYIEYVNDAYFCKPIIESARLIGKKNPTYLYLFSYEGQQGRNAMGRQSIEDYKGAFHGEEMAYLWFRNNLPKMNSRDQLLHERMMKLWSNFVKTGNPTPNEDVILERIIWPPVLPNMTYLEINNILAVRSNIKEDMMSFWKRIYSQYGRPPYDTY